MPGGFTPPVQIKWTGVPARRKPGGAGQNARLAAKLTGYKIDIKPESAPGEPLAPEEAPEPESTDGAVEEA